MKDSKQNREDFINLAKTLKGDHSISYSLQARLIGRTPDWIRNLMNDRPAAVTDSDFKRLKITFEQLIGESGVEQSSAKDAIINYLEDQLEASRKENDLLREKLNDKNSKNGKINIE